VTLSLDHTPPRITSSNLFSSVSGFHTGHEGQSWEVIRGLPPKTAGVVLFITVQFASTLPVVPAPMTAPVPAIKFVFINSRRE
jgi:hypothetical protein